MSASSKDDRAFAVPAAPVPVASLRASIACAAARELGILSAQKAKAPILAKARQLCREQGREPPAALYPVLILGMGDRAT